MYYLSEIDGIIIENQDCKSRKERTKTYLFQAFYHEIESGCTSQEGEDK